MLKAHSTLIYNEAIIETCRKTEDLIGVVRSSINRTHECLMHSRRCLAVSRDVLVRIGRETVILAGVSVRRCSDELPDRAIRRSDRG